MKLLSLSILLLLASLQVQSFVGPQPLIRTKPACAIHQRTSFIRQISLDRTSPMTTTLSMYNLPPSGGGGGGKGDGGILGSVATFAAITLFFLSPLGSIFFAITNSLFVLALLLPVVGFAAFQAWQFFNVVQGPCPNCAAQASALKDSPGICLNCGAVVQASRDGKTIELGQQQSGGMNDAFGGSGSIFDALSQMQQPQESTTTPEQQKQKQQRIRREGTIIDVEVEDE